MDFRLTANKEEMNHSTKCYSKIKINYCTMSFNNPNERPYHLQTDSYANTSSLIEIEPTFNLTTQNNSSSNTQFMNG